VKQKQSVNAQELGELTGYAKSTICIWLKNGVLSRNKAGKLDVADSIARIRSHEQQRKHEGKHPGPTAALRDRYLQKKIDLLDHQLAIARGSVHNKVACACSLTEARVAESRNLMALGDRLATRFPELGHRIKAACDEEVAAVLERLHSGKAYEVSEIQPHTTKGEQTV